MPPRRRSFKRTLGQKRYRKLYVISAEGTKTEPQYFAIFNNEHAVVRVICLRAKGGGNHSLSSGQIVGRRTCRGQTAKQKITIS